MIETTIQSSPDGVIVQFLEKMSISDGPKYAVRITRPAYYTRQRSDFAMRWFGGQKIKKVLADPAVVSYAMPDDNDFVRFEHESHKQFWTSDKNLANRLLDAVIAMRLGPQDWGWPVGYD